MSRFVGTKRDCVAVGSECDSRCVEPSSVIANSDLRPLPGSGQRNHQCEPLAILMISFTVAACSTSRACTISNCVSRIPDRTKRPQVTPRSDGSNSTITGAVRFAQTRSAEGVSSSTCRRGNQFAPPTLFSCAFSFAISTASASVSQRIRCARQANILAAAMARIPVPVPTSRKLPPA